MAAHPSAFLLNNNDLARTLVYFVEWLEHAWLPQAQRLGLRYIAHVVQADKGVDVLTLTNANHLNGLLELQLFHDVSAAKDWLHHCQQQAGVPPPKTTYLVGSKAGSESNPISRQA